MAPTTSASPGTKNFEMKVAKPRSWFRRVAIGFRRLIVGDNEKFSNTFTFVLLSALGITAYVFLLILSLSMIVAAPSAITISVFVGLMSPLIFSFLRMLIRGIKKNMPTE